jgi:hypothetical protein
VQRINEVSSPAFQYLLFKQEINITKMEIN